MGPITQRSAKKLFTTAELVAAKWMEANAGSVASLSLSPEDLKRHLLYPVLARSEELE
jgi:hypothetical protein